MGEKCRNARIMTCKGHGTPPPRQKPRLPIKGFDADTQPPKPALIAKLCFRHR
jgi:hypothetical protein